jgi:predicted nucleotide-binding protein (sugar kinase/HSP70/actin superfamily)
MNLLDRGVDFIWYPAVPYERKEDPEAGNHYNCPIVAGYPEVVRGNIDAAEERGVPVHMPYLSMQDKKKLAKRLYQELGGEGFTLRRIRRAVDAAWAEKERAKADLRRKGEEALEEIERLGVRGIVLAGRPYHTDPEVNHGIPDLINQLGMAVLTEDAVAHLADIERPLRVIDQWVYHNRLYAAAHFVGKTRGVEMVQLTSFGCGLDAVTSDQIHEILHRHGKIYTLLKIDEGNQLGAARIRLRSLKAVMDERQRRGITASILAFSPQPHPAFTREMKETYTILAPQVSPIHFELTSEAFRLSGYKLEVLPSVDHQAVETGLKYVHNDACYPSILVVGQLIGALQSGKYDLNRTALMITQTGGGCRATNYIAFLRKALADAGYGHVPVISLNAAGLEDHPGFSIGPKMARRSFQALVYGDLLMRVLLRTRPYEVEPGSAERLYRKWMERCLHDLKSASTLRYHRNLREIVRDFDTIPLREEKKPRVGLVGEILVKFHPTANNEIIKIVEREGAEAVMPDFLDFFLYTAHTGSFKESHLSGTKKQKLVSRAVIHYIERYRKVMRSVLEESRRFEAPPRIEELEERTRPIISAGAIMGEGWFLTGEMIELIEEGADNVVCMQPFACLPNQITGKGMIKLLKKRYPGANIAAIDYDPGASEVNQLNRIKLMLSVAFKKLRETESPADPEAEAGFVAGAPSQELPAEELPGGEEAEGNGSGVQDAQETQTKTAADSEESIQAS